MKKKKIIFASICFIIFLLFFILMFTAVLNIEVKTSSDNIKIIPKVIVDAGHGGEDGGAVNSDGVMEKDINLVISNNISDLLYMLGFDIIKTRDSDISLDITSNTIHARKVADMKKRLEIFNSDENNIILSIHQNKFPQSKYHGTQIFYSPNNPKSQLLAESLRLSIKKQLQPDNDRECKKSDNNIYLLKNTRNPAVITECGFISNYEECKKLLTDNYQKQISFAIVTGFLDFYNTN